MTKIGKVSQVYLDDTSGQPKWVTVNTGLFGTKESFVPLEQASFSGGALSVPVTKDQVKDAPRSRATATWNRPKRLSSTATTA
ncbi:MAG: PRC-barrel domain-containing protein [Geodermatophilaceae bacterium]